MTFRALCTRDSKALTFAAIAAFGLTVLQNPDPGLQATSQTASETASRDSLDDSSLDGLLDAEAAQTAGAWWLDDPTVTARLGFAPEHDRLVWRVGTGEQQVLLDAVTGEALSFEFE
jgi:hypothetical protein